MSTEINTSSPLMMFFSLLTTGTCIVTKKRTDKTITTSMDMSSIGQNISNPYVYSGLNLSVSSGLNYETKIVTPA